MVSPVRHLQAVFLILFLSVCPLTLSYADLADGEKAAEQARKEFDKRYKEFTLDRNVMGKAKDTNGKVVLEGSKVQFDKDDGVSYKSYLTYHDFSYNSEDEAFKQKQGNQPPPQPGQPPQKNTRTLVPFVSSHGAQEGDSSQLEKAMYKLHDKYSEEKEDPNKKTEEGIEYKSVFKIETKEVKADQIQQGATGGSTGGASAGTTGGATGGSTAGANKPEDKDEVTAVQRASLRPDVQEEAQKIGKSSFETIDQASKEEGKKDDPKQMGNILFLQDAAGRATESWWNSTLSNLGQRIARTSLGPLFANKIQLSEGVATCEASIAQLQAEVAKLPPDQQKKKLEELQQMTQSCKQVTQLSYNTVNPEFKQQDNNGQKEMKLETGNVKEEDGYQRDLRNQLEVLKGKSVTEVPSNWKYDPKEDKAKVVLEYNEDGTAKDPVELTMQEQADEYNKQLEESMAGFKDVKKRFTNIQINEDEIGKAFKIEKVDPMEINKYRNTQLLNEESGGQLKDNAQAENYDQLLEASQK